MILYLVERDFTPKQFTTRGEHQSELLYKKKSYGSVISPKEIKENIFKFAVVFQNEGGFTQVQYTQI